MKSSRLLVCLAPFVGALWMPLPSSAQDGAGMAATRSATYLLGPGDVLRVSVAGFPEFSLDSIIVPPDGVVSLARLGPIRLSGRTSASVQSEIRQKLIAKVRLRNPQVAVIITTVRSGITGSVTLIGAVPRGGNFPVREGERLSNLLAEAGLNERLEERRATLSRGSTRRPLDLRGAASRPGSVADIRLRAGDSIAVRVVAAGKITLQGDVERPGVYELHLNPRAEASELGLRPRLGDLITRAGGLKSLDNSASGGVGNGVAPPTAAATGEGAGAALKTNPFDVAAPLQSAPRLTTSYTATLQRRGGDRGLNVEAALSAVSGSENIVLQAGDVVTVRLVRPITVYVDGAATKTGSFQLAPGSGVLELLTLAGPLTRSPGDLRAAIRRGNETIPLDLPELLLSSESGANVRLQDQDLVQLREPETVGVSVGGQVARPGPIKVRPNATIYDALLAVGGLAAGTSAEGARLNFLRRESDGSQRVYKANAAGILSLTDVSTNYVLHEGDIINVARGEDQTVFVSGEVQNSASFTILPGEGLAQIVTRAGGPKDDAALTRIRVTRKGQLLTVDAYDAIKNGRPLAFALEAGDIVNVPVNADRVLAVEAFSKPGYYSIPERGQLTLLNFLTQAAPLAGVKKLYLLKANPDGTVNTSDRARREINIEDLRRGRLADFALSPRDVIFAVPPKSGGGSGILGLLGPLTALRFLF